MGGMDWIYLARDKDWPKGGGGALEDKAMGFRIP
jgi:hypothetical protein